MTYNVCAHRDIPMEINVHVRSFQVEHCQANTPISNGREGNDELAGSQSLCLIEWSIPGQRGSIKMKHYQHILAMIFAIDEINKNSELLPNTTLGVHIYDNFFDSKTTYETILDLLFPKKNNSPNYKCDRKHLLSVIGGFTIEKIIQMTTILSIYKIPQLTYGEYQPESSSKTDFTSLYWMVPRESILFRGIIQLLLHFQWKWIGLIVSDDDEDGQNFVQKLTPMLAFNNICLAFLKRVRAKKDLHDFDIIENSLELMIIYSTDAKVIILSMGTDLINILTDHLEEIELTLKILLGRIWIMPIHWYFTITFKNELHGRNIFHGSFSFSLQTNTVPGFKDFLENVNIDETLHPFFCIFRKYVFDTCEKSAEKEILEQLLAYVFDRDMLSESYTIYNTVYSIAHALHAIYLSRQRTFYGKFQHKHLNVRPWQLQSLLRNIKFNNSAGHEISFAHGEFFANLDLINWVTFPNQTYSKVRVGKLSPTQEFTFSENTIQWNTRLKQVSPHSLCVESCHVGQSKIIQEGKPICCYDCVSCSKDMISSQMDAAHCILCPQDQYPNSNQDQCIPKILTFLSYHEPIGVALASFAISFAFITCFVILVFIKNWNTPIVRANNRNLSWVLLVSLLLSYLCSLLFIGKPTKVSCLLQITAFGIIFSIAVSCVLAKTIIVVLAFMATEPGNRIAKWLGQKVANSIVISCSLVEGAICAARWLISPPFPDVNLDSPTGQMETECSEGSINMFYYVLGYLAFLAIISFIVAFLARNLPDTFNEAKFITFSMLVFCSVWISFIPVYLSIKGKKIVIVEIFAILASNTGLLTCIFFPKCYIIIFRPDLNTKKVH
ncbi:vomeronasal type-2 receptor 26-like [Protobothrops mucrosquamatus]|uniref:vomeronasal type-2 receptor 26-like n=1 Tax=Protobothrops mucrosquamatus TaxID=103944 RepID=UPI000775EE2E|nr:vomeronasal type-2 receptor 26-like [Protobothrops mucrosquamatus]